MSSTSPQTGPDRSARVLLGLAAVAVAFAAAVTSEPKAKSTSAANRTGVRPRRSAIRPMSGSIAT